MTDGDYPGFLIAVVKWGQALCLHSNSTGRRARRQSACPHLLCPHLLCPHLLRPHLLRPHLSGQHGDRRKRGQAPRPIRRIRRSLEIPARSQSPFPRPLSILLLSLLFGLLPSAAVCVEGESASQGARELLTIRGGAGYITFSPDSQRLAGNVAGATWRSTDIRIWEVATGKELLTLKGQAGGIWKLSFGPGGKRLASNDNYTVKIWDLETKKEIRSFKTPAFTRSVVFIDNGKRLATGHDDGRIRLWDVDSARMVGTLKGHTDWVPSLALSRDGKWLASGSVDRTAKLWDLTTGKEVLALRGHEW